MATFARGEGAKFPPSPFFSLGFSLFSLFLNLIVLIALDPMGFRFKFWIYIFYWLPSEAMAVVEIVP